MADVDKALQALKAFEARDIDRHRPPPEKPLTEAEQFAKALSDAQSPWHAAPTGWLR